MALDRSAMLSSLSESSWVLVVRFVPNYLTEKVMMNFVVSFQNLQTRTCAKRVV